MGLVFTSCRIAPSELTSDRETDSSAHIDKRRKEHLVSWNSRLDLHSPQSDLPLFSKTTRPTALFTVHRDGFVRGSWMAQLVFQSEGGERSSSFHRTV